MRITLETTEHGEGYPYRSVTLEMGDDDTGIDNLIEDFIRPLLIGWGYAPETVADAIGEPS